jgi:uridylate kinase
MAYKRVLLKLSGEALAGDKKTGFDEDTCVMVGKQIKQLVDGGTQVAIVIGGGNFWRGRSSETIGRVQADQIGMLATVMNCIYVSEILRTLGMKTGIYTQFEIGSVTEVFHMDTVNEALSEGKVVFLAGGTGHPYFSTDTAT